MPILDKTLGLSLHRAFCKKRLDLAVDVFKRVYLIAISVSTSTVTNRTCSKRKSITRSCDIINMKYIFA